MTGGSKGGARSGDEMRNGAGQGISGFDPTLGADPIFAAAGRSEEQQQQSQQASSQVATAAATSPLLYSTCPTDFLAYTYHIFGKVVSLGLSWCSLPFVPQVAITSCMSSSNVARQVQTRSQHRKIYKHAKPLFYFWKDVVCSPL